MFHKVYVALMLMSVLSMTACGNPPVETSNPWWPEFEAAIARSNSDFEKQVLSDGKVTQEEYMEAIALYTQCLEEHNIDVSVHDHGMKAITPPVGMEYETADKLEFECSIGTIFNIEAFYWDVQRNPQNENWDDIVIACLIREGFAPEGYTAHDFDKYRDEALSYDPIVNECQDNPISDSTSQK